MSLCYGRYQKTMKIVNQVSELVGLLVNLERVKLVQWLDTKLDWHEIDS